MHKKNKFWCYTTYTSIIYWRSLENVYNTRQNKRNSLQSVIQPSPTSTFSSPHCCCISQSQYYWFLEIHKTFHSVLQSQQVKTHLTSILFKQMPDLRRHPPPTPATVWCQSVSQWLILAYAVHL